MAKKPETIFKESVLKDLKTLPYTYAVKIQQVAIRGTPDILACVHGHFVALELKKDAKQSPDFRQEYELKKIKKSGGISLCVDPLSWPGVLCYLTKIANMDPKFPPEFKEKAPGGGAVTY